MYVTPGAGTQLALTVRDDTLYNRGSPVVSWISISYLAVVR